jgi:hypothetical protein
MLLLPSQWPLAVQILGELSKQRVVQQKEQQVLVLLQERNWKN